MIISAQLFLILWNLTYLVWLTDNSQHKLAYNNEHYDKYMK